MRNGRTLELRTPAPPADGRGADDAARARRSTTTRNKSTMDAKIHRRDARRQRGDLQRAAEAPRRKDGRNRGKHGGDKPFLNLTAEAPATMSAVLRRGNGTRNAPAGAAETNKPADSARDRAEAHQETVIARAVSGRHQESTGRHFNPGARTGREIRSGPRSATHKVFEQQRQAEGSQKANMEKQVFPERGRFAAAAPISIRHAPRRARSSAGGRRCRPSENRSRRKTLGQRGNAHGRPACRQAPCEKSRIRSPPEMLDSPEATENSDAAWPAVRN